VELKKLRSLDLKQQLLFCEAYLPDAYEFLRDTNRIKLPKFDENDEVISWGVTPQVTPQDTPKVTLYDEKEE
jgi:hypothetical protein